MFLRTTRVKRPDGRVDEYIRLVESYWNQGRPRHRIVCNLGRKDVLALILATMPTSSTIPVNTSPLNPRAYSVSVSSSISKESRNDDSLCGYPIMSQSGPIC